MTSPMIARDVRAYLATALWSSRDEDGTPFDATHDVEDFTPEALAQAAANVERFRQLAGDVYALAQEFTGYDDGHFMHDLWLTQNGHGAGFWDGDYGPYGDALTRAAEIGETDVVRGDDGKLHLV